MNKITEKQNDSELVKLLKASSVAYSKAKKWETKFTYSLIFLAIAYPISYVLIKDETIKLILFGCSFFLTILLQVITGKLKGNTSKGAIIKEEFDTALYCLPWKSTLSKPDHAEISKLSLEYEGEAIKNWYSQCLLPSIPHNIGVAILQHSNTSWDNDLRKHFRDWLIWILVIYSVLLFSFFVVMKVEGLTLFSICFSILSFYTHFISLIRGHNSAIEKREAISKHLDIIIRIKKEVSNEELRDIQDEIFSTRQEPAKVPNFFFRMLYKKMNAMDEDYINSINTLYNSKPEV
ncbi:MAG: S-4TM family putative pore-forming effector [Prolixibacteraceae bacterium]|nr:S-4TM family putative pore-forming effector [Prolixibacteraceae bacterium]